MDVINVMLIKVFIRIVVLNGRVKCDFCIINESLLVGR